MIKLAEYFSPQKNFAPFYLIFLTTLPELILFFFLFNVCLLIAVGNLNFQCDTASSLLKTIKPNCNLPS